MTSKIDISIPVINEEVPELALLALTEQAILLVMSRTKEKTRRHNRLVVMLENCREVERTYRGHLPTRFCDAAEQFIRDVGVKFDALLDVES